MTSDPRLKAFLTDGEEVFSGVQQGQHLWKQDPFDVESVNATARRAFQRLLNRAVASPPPDTGKILLLRGESGSGKTHLVRAFRNLVHGRTQGYVGYLPMTVDTPHYGRHVLRCVMDSLDRPYDERVDETSGLMKLSDALMGTCKSVFAPLIAAERILEDEELHEMVSTVAYELHREDPRFRAVSVDLLRALLFLQHRDVRLHHAVLQWMRCRELSPADARVLGNLVSHADEEGPQWMLEQVGHLLGVLGQAFVLCVDQVEDIADFALRPGMEPPFRRAMNFLVHLAGNVPTAIIVVCCLSDFWVSAREGLMRPMLDRIEHDPEPVQLDHLVTAQTARDIAALRLKVLYERRGAAFDPGDPTWPFPPAGFESLSGWRPRDVLDLLRRYRDHAIQEGRLPERFPLEGPAQGGGKTEGHPPQPTPVAELEQAWIDFRATFQAQVPTEDEDLSILLAWSLKTANDELDSAARVTVRTRDGASLELTSGPEGQRLLVALCNKSSRGGHLGRQMAEAIQSAKGQVPVLVRTTEFPSSTGTVVAEQFLRLQKKGGRRVVLGDGDLRDLLALRAFLQKPHDASALNAWRQAQRPLTRLKLLGDILGIDPNGSSRQGQPPSGSGGPASGPRPSQDATAPAPKSPDAPPKTSAPRPRTPTGPLRLGTQEGLFESIITLDPEVLTRHSAFLGSTGSGKTTVALNIAEQLLARDIPVILVDRKGDLAGYAREEAWSEPLADPALEERRRQLRERLDVALYTPGRSDGRPLAIPVVPRGLDALPAEEREQAVQQAADAIAGMLEYKSGSRDKSARALLGQALQLLVRRPLGGRDVTLEMLQQFIHSADPELVREAEGLDPKSFTKLTQDLTMLRLNSRVLLSASGERLDLEALLGRSGAGGTGRARLSVISTKFLGGTPSVLFWVSQLLLETLRWASQHPSSTLQAVLLFDEADLYLPALGQPATKQPMESLLKRARSAGVGVMLATQSPGDLDYKCRENVGTWLVGRVKEDTALKKLKPLFSNGRGADGTQKLAAQEQGQFHLQAEGATRQLKADRNLIPTRQLSEEEILRLARLTLERVAGPRSP
ncbi:TonB-dependent receptor [Cystobacter fuscus DSM 2262]|uniref:TonB-dependent receptor n=1 Tax=Cystobacter fuscus (strain ATCC 25194 / DSM 2262 / NBRC 100088 / M29) TaxID=1242864 RepID=S9P3J2_CYSF2|nr:helicase HerA-like domain-containing protein [Cystobacter fuscus]EPX56832.1 TonB-dependent receptor [Cystobacter fuscus DSM 2262]